MGVYKSRAIVLRSMRYVEADRILDLYTEDRGMISAIAKGVRRTTSRFGGRLEPLSCIELLAYHGRSLDTITQAEVLRSFHGVREHLGRLDAAGGMVRAIRSLSGEDEGDRRIFNLLYRSLEVLEAREGCFKSVEAGFLAKLTLLAGYAPALDACLSCGMEVESRAFFSPSGGGALCERCAKAAPDAFLLRPGMLPVLREVLGRTVADISLREDLEEPVLGVVRAHAMAHAPVSGRMGRRRPA